MPIKTHRLTFPLTEADARELHAGDLVIIDGEIIVTAGIPTHERMVGCLEGKEPTPMELQGASVFHLGSFSREVDGRFEVLYINPTTSTRFNPVMPRLIEGFKWHAVGGKGGLDDASVKAMQAAGCVYLSFLGGGATLLSQAVKEVVQVGWSDMLTHYRLVRLKVEGLGPVTVGIDAHGRSLYAEEQASVRERLPDILATLATRRESPKLVTSDSDSDTAASPGTGTGTEAGAGQGGQTIVQKILARHSGKSRVEPGEHVTCSPDHVVTQELYWPTHKRNLDRIGTRTLAKPEKAIIVIDHTPSAAMGSQHAATHRLLKDITAEMGVENFFGPNTGLRHLVLVERGFARPGSLIFSDEGNIASIGAVGALNIPMSSDVLVPLLKDENWVTVPKTVRVNMHGRLQFGVSARDVIQTLLRDHGGGEFLQCCVEYGGPALEHLSMDDRQTILASTFHAMSDTAIMDVDEVALDYVRQRAGDRPYEPVKSDPDAVFDRVIELDLSRITPMVTVPPEQTGATPVEQVAGKRIHQASVGSCAGNRLQDLRDAATLLRGRKIARHVTMYVSPGSQNIYAQAAREGLLEVFADAGATVLSPGCNTCWGYLGVLNAGEVSINTHQFNYQGRNGSDDSLVYLASPLTVAASAIAGEITDPRPMLRAAQDVAQELRS